MFEASRRMTGNPQSHISATHRSSHSARAIARAGSTTTSLYPPPTAKPIKAPSSRSRTSFPQVRDEQKNVARPAPGVASEYPTSMETARGRLLRVPIRPSGPGTSRAGGNMSAAEQRTAEDKFSISEMVCSQISHPHLNGPNGEPRSTTSRPASEMPISPRTMSSESSRYGRGFPRMGCRSASSCIADSSRGKLGSSRVLRVNSLDDPTSFA